MKKIIIYLTLAFLLFSFVSAIEFTEETVFKEGNINYIFVPNLEIDITHIGSGGIILNGDNKMSFSPQGGILNVTILDWVNKTIRMQSDVPQKIDINVDFNGEPQFLNDGETNHFESVDLRYEPIDFTFGTFEESIHTKYDKVPRLHWYEQKFIEFEVSTYEDEEGIIHNKTISITYVYLTFFILLIILLWVVFK